MGRGSNKLHKITGKNTAANVKASTLYYRLK